MNTFTLPWECVLAVPLTAPQQGALPVCALVVPGLVGSMKLMSHCHAWVSDKTGNLISSGFVIKNKLYPVFTLTSVTCMCIILKFCFPCIVCNILYLHNAAQYSLCDKCADCLASFCHFYNNPFISTLFLSLVR